MRTIHSLSETCCRASLCLPRFRCEMLAMGGPFPTSLSTAQDPPQGILARVPVTWRQVVAGSPQSSKLGTLLFHFLDKLIVKAMHKA